MSKPEPFTPPNCDLRGMPYMPLDVVRLFDSDFYALSNGEEFKAGLSLWCKAFLQVPAGSLPTNDRLLAHLSGAGARWDKVKEMALHGWIECSDGRLYHRVVAEKVRDAWQSRIDRRRRTEAARAARHSDSTPPTTGNDTSHVPKPVTPYVPISVTEPVTSSKGSTREQNGREQEEERSSVAIATAAPAQPIDARDAVWREGLPIIKALTGKPDAPSRTFLGKLVKAADDDCAKVLASLQRAAAIRPIDPASWLVAELDTKRKTPIRNGFLANIAKDDAENVY